jgi:hypothetical protein
MRCGVPGPAIRRFLRRRPAEWSYESPERYYSTMMEIVAPVQHLMAECSDSQRQEVKRLIIEAASAYRQGDRITFPIAVRVVAGRKPA